MPDVVQETLRAPASAAMRNQNEMKLGTFGMNCSSGMAFTKKQGRIVPTWDEQVRIAKLCDDNGWEFLLPLARWLGFGGATNPHGAQMEVFTWAAGLAAVTSQIQLIATAHVSLFEPLVAAKQGATIDQISGGRFALNVVAGWNSAEMALAGKVVPEHATRYAIADEWITIVERLWTESEPFDFHGRFYTAENAQIWPKPIQQPRPVIIQAGSSPEGQDFAARHADFGFQTFPDLEKFEKMNRDQHAAATSYDRAIGIIGTAYVVCADTEAEALRIHDHYVDDLGDFEAAKNLVDQLISNDARSWPHDAYQDVLRGIVAGVGAMPLIGTPEMIVERLVKLKAIGLDGIALSWIDYAEGIEQFNEQVIPLMVSAGLRRA